MTVIVPTNDPGAIELEYRAKGFKLMNLYAKPFYRTLCDPNLDAGCQWAAQMWKPEPPAQGELM